MNKPDLLVSVFFADEVRAALLGGADIIDCEDPRTDVGMYMPGDITDIVSAVRQAEEPRRIRTSVNIGASLQLFVTGKGGRALARSDREVQSRAAQEALGFAAALDMGDVRSNIIKFGVDGIQIDHVAPLVKTVKDVIRNSSRFYHYQVIGSFLPIDLDLWAKRSSDDDVVRQLVRQGVFYFDPDGSLDLKPLFSEQETKEIMAGKSDQSKFNLVEPYSPKELGLGGLDLDGRTKRYVEEIARGGADGVMIDTPVQAKASRICLLEVPENRPAAAGMGLPLQGLYTQQRLQMFLDYCEFFRMEAWTAGSVQPYHAKVLGKMANLDVVLCRGAVSSPPVDPYNPGAPPKTDRPSQRVDVKKVQVMVSSLRA
jgi:hypothetical protein